MLDKPVFFLATSNQTASREFYERTMELNLISSDPYALVFGVDKFELRIQIVESVIEVPYTSFGWVVSDIRKVIEKLRNRGVSFQKYEALKQDEYKIWHSPGGARIAWFKDPDGNVLSLTQYS